MQFRPAGAVRHANNGVVEQEEVDASGIGAVTHGMVERSQSALVSIVDSGSEIQQSLSAILNTIN